MKRSVLIFDLDGTLVDSIGDIRLAAQAALCDLLDKPLTDELVKTYVGRGLKRTLGGIISHFGFTLDDREVGERTTSMLEHYRKHPVVLSRPYEGVVELLARLSDRGLQLGVLSNKEDGLTKTIVATLFPSVKFVLVRGLRQGYEPKPHPSTLGEFSALLGIENEQMLYIGDSEIDWQTANNASMDAVIVTWGFRPREALQALEHVPLVDTIDELEEAINDI
jgi:phosphoglycolate phosphatase